MKAGKFTINLPLAGKHNRPANFSSPGDVDVAHARLWETGGEHRVEADHVEKVQSVVILHLLHVCHVLQEKLIKIEGLPYWDILNLSNSYSDLAPILPKSASIVNDNCNLQKNIGQVLGKETQHQCCNYDTMKGVR